MKSGPLFNQALVKQCRTKIVEINVLGKQPELNQDDEILIEISIALGKTYSEVADLPYEKSESTPPTSESTEPSTFGRRFEQELARIPSVCFNA